MKNDQPQDPLVKLVDYMRAIFLFDGGVWFSQCDDGRMFPAPQFYFTTHPPSDAANDAAC